MPCTDIMRREEISLQFSCLTQQHQVFLILLQFNISIFKDQKGCWCFWSACFKYKVKAAPSHSSMYLKVLSRGYPDTDVTEGLGKAQIFIFIFF